VSVSVKHEAWSVENLIADFRLWNKRITAGAASGLTAYGLM